MFIHKKKKKKKKYHIFFQRGVVWDLLKQLGSNLVEGKDLVNLSMPVGIFEPRSFLERLADGWAFLPSAIDLASREADPVRRLKLVATGVLAGLHLKCEQAKPFNPILGETYEAVYEAGHRLYVEQVSHHPPVTAWEVFAPGPSPAWVYTGTCLWKASLRGNTIKGCEAGDCTVSFRAGPAAGSSIVFSLPTVALAGIAWGERRADFCGKLVATDSHNGLTFSVLFNPDVQSTSGYLKSLIFTPAHPSDYFKGAIANAKGKELCQVEGSWLSHISFDGVKMWELGKPAGAGAAAGVAAAPRPTPVPDPLPSDSRFRTDLITLRTGDLVEAQKEKNRLEELQRADRKLRQEKKPRSGHPKSAAKTSSSTPSNSSPVVATASRDTAADGEDEDSNVEEEDVVGF
jgi:hypothetical protein